MIKSKVNLLILIFSRCTTAVIAQCTITPTIINLPVFVDINGGAVFLSLGSYTTTFHNQHHSFSKQFGFGN